MVTSVHLWVIAQQQCRLGRITRINWLYFWGIQKKNASSLSCRCIATRQPSCVLPLQYGPHLLLLRFSAGGWL